VYYRSCVPLIQGRISFLIQCCVYRVGVEERGRKRRAGGRSDARDIIPTASGSKGPEGAFRIPFALSRIQTMSVAPRLRQA
jgi:hypothetical protein